jgi:hypothetical protein
VQQPRRQPSVFLGQARMIRCVGIMNWKGYRRKWAWPNKSYYPGIWRLRKTTKNLRHDMQSPGRDLNPRSPEYEARMPTTRSRLKFSVSLIHGNVRIVYRKNKFISGTYIFAVISQTNLESFKSSSRSDYRISARCSVLVCLCSYLSHLMNR